MTIPQVTVSGTYEDAEGNPATGTVTFKLNTPLQDSTDPEVTVSRTPVVATLVAGAFSQVLAATSGGDILPTSGVLYTVTEQITGSRTRRRKVAFPSSTPTVDMGDVLPVDDTGVVWEPGFSEADFDAAAVKLTDDQTVAGIKLFTSGIKSRQADGSAIDAKPAGDGSQGIFNWTLNDTTGYLFHLTTGTGAADPAACIGIGVDNGGRGLLIANKKTGMGMSVTQQSSITSATAYGFWGSQQSTLAPLMRLEQTATGVAALLELYAITGATSGQKLQRWLTADIGTLGDVDANTGRFSWNTGLLTFGNSSLATDLQLILNSAVGKNRDIYWQTGGSNRWTLRVTSGAESGSNAGSDMQLIARTDAGATIVVPLTIRRSDGRITLGEACNLQFGTTTGTKIGTASTEKLAFYGATPIVRPSGVAVTAEGVHAALVSLGLIAA